MTRFMMTLEDAVDLVLYAFENGKHGDIFVQKSPASTIGDLAQALLNYIIQKVKIKLSVHAMVKSCTKHWSIEKKWSKLRNWESISEFLLIIVI